MWCGAAPFDVFIGAVVLWIRFPNFDRAFQWRVWLLFVVRQWIQFIYLFIFVPLGERKVVAMAKPKQNNNRWSGCYWILLPTAKSYFVDFFFMPAHARTHSTRSDFSIHSPSEWEAFAVDGVVWTISNLSHILGSNASNSVPMAAAKLCGCVCSNEIAANERNTSAKAARKLIRAEVATEHIFLHYALYRGEKCNNTWNLHFIDCHLICVLCWQAIEKAQDHLLCGRWSGGGNEWARMSRVDCVFVELFRLIDG